MSNRIKRKTLDEADIARESAAIREMGFTFSAINYW